MVTTYLLIWLWNGIKYCHRRMVSWLLLSQQARWRILFVVLKKKRWSGQALLKTQDPSSLICHKHSGAVKLHEHFRGCTGTNEIDWDCGGNTHFLLLIGSDGRDISRKAAVAAAVDFLVIKAGGVEAHSLLSLLHQGGLFTLNLKDLSLDVWN